MTAFLLLLALPAAFAGKVNYSLPDSDGDGVSDPSDLCDGEDDSVDLDADGIQDCVQTFVNDFGFRYYSSLYNWNSPQVSWTAWGRDTIDGNSYANSGSMKMRAFTNGGGIVVDSDCLAVDPSTLHVMATQMKVESVVSNPHAALTVTLFDSLADCQINGTSARRVIYETSMGNTGWRTWGDRFTTDATEHAVQIAFSTGVYNQTATVTLWVDNILLHDVSGEVGNPGEPGPN